MSAFLIAALLLAQQPEQQPAILRMDGATRAKVLAALAGLIILGFLLIALAWLGARMTRRYMGPPLKPLSSALPTDEEWTRPKEDDSGSVPEAGPRKKKG